MKAAFDEAKRMVLVWKLVLWKMILYSLVTFCTAWLTATNGLSFGALNRWEQVNIIAGIIALWGQQMVALFDKTAGQVASGQLPIDNNSTDNNKQTKGNE